MMRVIGLCLLCILAFVVSIVVLFPASYVTERIKKDIVPIALSNVEGKLYNGKVGLLENKDDLLPLEFQNVSWKLAPSTIPTGGGVKVKFDGYGGGGEGLVKRAWNGDMSVTNLNFSAKTPEFDSFPLPFASLKGDMTGKVQSLQLKNQLLTEFVGQVFWNDAELALPVVMRLGKVELDVKPEGENTHIANIKARGGQVDADGKVTLSLAGDFNADVVLTPTSSATPDVASTLSQFARRDAQGRYRWVQRGTVNRL